ncbi:hypothetical protein I8752_23165 [Nostocaceae cyanobacterium CENA369]|uniref:Uncharacterized protein n=1 Tax=Dendronalium phyllosphericum CENA369 TaxID=1725256 RepID=A0A8J7ICG2_9NOST|nr:hypothetical protein [Dendronalium phyllosphericum]MBH8575847.1 hypothetical protein [Dendronalium phyllosphericum CENA369]
MKWILALRQLPQRVIRGCYALKQHKISDAFARLKNIWLAIAVLTVKPKRYTPFLITTISWRTLEEQVNFNHNDKVFQ